jgi:predicted SnoaL-like aldol condensation-catalyzing enzyme
MPIDIAHGRFSGHGRPRSWIAVDIVRVENGKLAEHWDVLQDEATQAVSRCSAIVSRRERGASLTGFPPRRR